MTKSEEDFFTKFLKMFPEFKGFYTKHLQVNGEVLPYVLMGDVTRFIIKMYRQGKISQNALDNDNFNRAINFLEDSYANLPDPIQDIIDLSFLENLHQAGEDYDSIKEQLGPILKERLADFE